MNGTHGGGCCSHDNSPATHDDREPDQETQARSASTSDGCCGAAADHPKFSQSSHPRVEQAASDAAVS